MKPSIENISAQFIIDKTGKKTAVILDIETFQGLLDELEDFSLSAIAHAALDDQEPTFPQIS